jgi:hypothetical protein
MKLSDQVITLEQAQKLHELGIDQQSAFSYVHNGAGWKIMPEGYYYVDPEGGEAYSAFTVAELGEMLMGVEPDGGVNSLSYLYDWHGHRISYYKTGVNCVNIDWLSSEVSLRCALLIRLIEEGLGSVETINNRINS